MIFHLLYSINFRSNWCYWDYNFFNRNDQHNILTKKESISRPILLQVQIGVCINIFSNWISAAQLQEKIDKVQQKSSEQADVGGKSVQGHVMISYQTAFRPLVNNIYTYLKQNVSNWFLLSLSIVPLINDRIIEISLYLWSWSWLLNLIQTRKYATL